MRRPLIVGLVTEGTTDVRFLSELILRTIEDLILREGQQLPDVYPIQSIPNIMQSFSDNILKASIEADAMGVSLLCVHVDADSKKDKDARENKIHPAFSRVFDSELHVCKNLVSVVPVQMTESWMLADIDLLKNEIMTGESKETLMLNHKPESYSDPKAAIVNAINIAQKDEPKRRRNDKVTIADLYLPLGQKIPLNKMENLPSYCKFKSELRLGLSKLHIIAQ